MKKHHVQGDKFQEQASGIGRTAEEDIERNIQNYWADCTSSHHFLCEANEQGLYCNFSLIFSLILNSYFW